MASAAHKAAEAWLAEHDGAAWCRDVVPIITALLAEQGAGGAFETISCPACNMVVGRAPLAPPPAPCGGRCEDALDSRSPCQSCAERLAPPPAPMAERDEWRGNAAMQAVMAGDRARERDTAESRLSRATEALRAARDTLAAVNYTPVYVVIERIDSALSEIGEPVRSVRERLGRDKTVPGHPGDPELLR